MANRCPPCSDLVFRCSPASGFIFGPREKLHFCAGQTKSADNDGVVCIYAASRIYCPGNRGGGECRPDFPDRWCNGMLGSGEDGNDFDVDLVVEGVGDAHLCSVRCVYYGQESAARRGDDAGGVWRGVDEVAREDGEVYSLGNLINSILCLFRHQGYRVFCLFHRLAY